MKQQVTWKQRWGPESLKMQRHGILQKGVKAEKKVWRLYMIIEWTFSNSPLRLEGVLKKEEVFHCLEEKQLETGSCEFWYSQFLLKNTDICVSPILSQHTTVQHLAEIFFNESCTQIILFINKYIEKRSPLEKMPGLIVKVTKCFYVEVVRAQYKK